jgi:hypothetical protein
MDEEPCTNYKSTPSEEISCWHKSVNKLPDDVQIDLDFLRELKLRESVPVAWCVENHEVYCLGLCSCISNKDQCTSMEDY